jgi:hypothetical protein
MTKDEAISGLQRQVAILEKKNETLERCNEVLEIKLTKSKKVLTTISQWTSQDSDNWEDQAFIAANCLRELNS